MNGFLSFEELDRLTGDVLPGRTVLSTGLLPLLGASPPSPAAPPPAPGAGTTVAYACQYVENPGPPGLIASLGLAPTTPGHSETCVPAAISSSH